MSKAPPLLIVANLPQGFRLDDLVFIENAGDLISINEAKYQGLEIKEAVVNGMAFILTLQGIEETQKKFATENFDQVFCNEPSPSAASIGISLSENIANASHVGTINRALLQLGKAVGDSVGASSIVWLPGGTNVGFEYFSEATELYVNSGAFPVLVQLSIAIDEQGLFKTCGLEYFADQEILLQAPLGYAENEAIKRLIRVAHDIATNGKIDTAIESDGLIPGERIAFQPSEDGDTVHIEIKADQPQQLH